MQACACVCVCVCVPVCVSVCVCHWVKNTYKVHLDRQNLHIFFIIFTYELLEKNSFSYRNWNCEDHDLFFIDGEEYNDEGTVQ